MFNKRFSVRRQYTIMDCRFIENNYLNTEASFGLETISETIEEITKENILHEGICALYKQGIMLVKSLLNF